MAEEPIVRTENLSAISGRDWNYDRAAHLLERAGFGGTPEEIERLAAMTPEQAVAALVDYETADDSHLRPFEESGLWDPTLLDFPVSRPAATSRAEKTGEAMGVKVKPGGTRPLQPVTNRFFYWLRATLLAPAVLRRFEKDLTAFRDDAHRVLDELGGDETYLPALRQLVDQAAGMYLTEVLP